MSIQSVEALPFRTTGEADEFRSIYPEEYALLRQPAPAPAPASEITACPVCGRNYVTVGKSIHYCVDRRSRPVGREFIAHYDNHQVGSGYDTQHQAEEALDDYTYGLLEQGLIGALDVPEAPVAGPEDSSDPDDVLDPRDAPHFIGKEVGAF